MSSNSINRLVSGEGERPPERLTERQQKFCINYARTRVLSQSAIDAGYKPANAGVVAYNLMKKPHVIREINTLIDKHKDSIQYANGVDKSYVLAKAVEVLNMCMRTEDVSNALKALDIIGKHIDINAFTPKKEDATTTNNTINNIIPASEFRQFINKTGILNSSFIDSNEKVLDVASGTIEDSIEIPDDIL